MIKIVSKIEICTQLTASFKLFILFQPNVIIFSELKLNFQILLKKLICTFYRFKINKKNDATRLLFQKRLFEDESLREVQI